MNAPLRPSRSASLDRLIPTPALLEVDAVDVAGPPARAWELVRHGDIGESALIRALFAVRTLADRTARRTEKSVLRFDELRSTAQQPGFQILHDDGRSELVVGAIGKVWHLQIPFVHVADGDAFRAFSEPGFVKVAWTLRVAPRGEDGARVTFELRVDATDADSWAKFKRYFAVIGVGSHFIRRSLLASFARRLGTPESRIETRALPGDTLLLDAGEQITEGVTIAATPSQIWPWLLQMGGRRAGFYSIDAADNDGRRSAREVHPDLAALRVGDVLPATPDGEDGFEVLEITPNQSLVLGGLYDADAKKQRAFDMPRPQRYWQVTWSFVLEPLDAGSTRLHVRARAAFSPNERLHAEWIRPVHHLMETTQLRNLAARVEGRLPRDDWRDVLEGIGGAAVMAAAFLTPFLRAERSHWGVDAEAAQRAYPGDALVASPRWGWTHGIEIEAPAEAVWPWIAQLGADRGGFYSYQWLENVAGCDLRNAEAIHPDLAMREGDMLRLHPDIPPLAIAELVPNRCLVVHAPADAAARTKGDPWAEVSWLFLLEPLGPRRCRLVSRYRCATSDDLATRARLGSSLVEPIGFAMDRRMLLGVKARAERAAAKKPLRSMRRRRSIDAR